MLPAIETAKPPTYRGKRPSVGEPYSLCGILSESEFTELLNLQNYLW
jgi:hypothetical protein